MVFCFCFFFKLNLYYFILLVNEIRSSDLIKSHSLPIKKFSIFIIATLSLSKASILKKTRAKPEQFSCWCPNQSPYILFFRVHSLAQSSPKLFKLTLTVSRSPKWKVYSKLAQRKNKMVKMKEKFSCCLDC